MAHMKMAFLFTSAMLVVASIQVAHADTPKLVSRIFLPSVVDPARSAHLQPLVDLALPPNEREVRVWIGFGVVSQMQLVRIQVASSGQIRGEAVFYHPPTPKNPSSDDASYFAELGKKCKDIGSSGSWIACQPIGTVGTDWTSTYHSMLALGLWDLPDESTLPPPSMQIMDGVGMLVELRDGANYRAYTYVNPGTNNAPEAQKAAKIMGITGDLSRVEID